MNTKTHNAFPLGRWTTKPLIDLADQSALLSASPLSGLIAQHETAGRYVLLVPSPSNPSVYNMVAENLSELNAREIVRAVTGKAK